MARWRLTPGTHLREYKYWQYALSGKPAIRMRMSAGDVIVRSSLLWHRGMPNKSNAIRPMLAFTWENGGSDLADPYTAHGGKITFLTNRYAQNLSGRLRERAFASLPALGTELLVHALTFSVGGRHQAIAILKANRFTPACAHKARRSLTPCAAA